MINRTICCLAVSFAAGLLYGRESKLWLCIAVICFLVLRALRLCWQQGRQAVFPVVIHTMLCAMLFAGGTYRYREQQKEFESVRQYAQGQKTIQAAGEIYWKEQKQEQFIYYLKDAGVFRAGQYYPCGRIQVYTSKDSYNIGNCIQAVGTYEAFQLPRNEGNFNEEQYYYSKKIGLRIRAQQEQILEGNPKKYKMWLQKLRAEIEQVLKDNMSQRTAGIMANMTLGSKNLADAEVKALYQKTGISHILAVSGVKTLCLVSPIGATSGLKWAFVRIHIVKKYIQNLCFKGQFLARCPSRFCGG